LSGSKRDVASVPVVGWGELLIGEPEAGVVDTDAVATTTIAVHRGVWSDPELALMVAPPVTVSSMPVERPMDPWRRGQLRRSRANNPVGRHRRPAR
jgi:hypothetical protein